jgi:hypothetical protein
MVNGPFKNSRLLNEATRDFVCILGCRQTTPEAFQALDRVIAADEAAPLTALARRSRERLLWDGHSCPSGSGELDWGLAIAD